MKQRQHPRRNTRADRASSGRGGHRKPASATTNLLLYGLHAVEAALSNPHRTILELTATKAAADRLNAAISARGIEPRMAENRDIAVLLPADAVHQGIIARVAPLAPVSLDDLAPTAPVIALDQVTDPHNVGAILRTAAAFGAAAVIAPEHGAPAPSGALAKAATGALEHVPYIQTANLARALESAKKAGYWIIGLDGESDTPFEDVAGQTPLLLVLGAEGSGLRRLTRERCDMLARLDLPGAIKTLNVSNAAAIALYVASRAAR